MTRSTLSSANRAEVYKAAVRIVEFVELAFPGGTIRVTTATRDIAWGGYTWIANALLLDYSGLREHAEQKGHRAALRLSGIDATLQTRIFTDSYHYARVQMWQGFLNESWVLVDTPYPLTDELLMSNCTLSVEMGKAEIELSAETWELFGQQDSAVLVTPENQRLRYTGDTGMDKVAHIMTLAIEWGGSTERVGGDRGGVVEGGLSVNSGSQASFSSGITGGGGGGSLPVAPQSGPELF